MPRRLAVLAALVFTFPAYPWGATGHRAAARIAERHLTPEAARAADELLGGESLAEISYWPDEVDSSPEWKHSDPWHYVNLAPGETYAAAEKNPAGDAVEALARFEAVLRDVTAPREARVTALKFVVHLVADLHQPLHVGPRADRGGNDKPVTWLGAPTNLHHVWDFRIIEASELSFSELADFADDGSPEEIRAWQADGVDVWLAEAMALWPAIYDIGDGKLGFAYRNQMLPVVEGRLARAGVRLAGRLNRVLAVAGT